MPSAGSSGLARLIEEHGAKALRYCGVSVVNVITGLSTLAFCLVVLDMSPVASNIAAWMVSTVPAYLLSRYWVWQQSGANSVKAEIVPFWILAVVGLAISSTAIWIAQSFTDRTLVLLAVNLTAYFFVWIAKYLVLDNVMWDDGEPAEVAAEVL